MNSSHVHVCTLTPSHRFHVECSEDLHIQLLWQLNSTIILQEEVFNCFRGRIIIEMFSPVCVGGGDKSMHRNDSISIIP